MLNFVQNLLNYMTFEVFESSWNLFEENIKNVSNIDDVISHHNLFLDTCLRDSILTSSSFLIIHKILSICYMFSSYVQGITKNIKVKEETNKLDMNKLTLREAQEKRKQALQVIWFKSV